MTFKCFHSLCYTMMAVLPRTGCKYRDNKQQYLINEYKVLELSFEVVALGGMGVGLPVRESASE